MSIGMPAGRFYRCGVLRFLTVLLLVVCAAVVFAAPCVQAAPSPKGGAAAGKAAKGKGKAAQAKKAEDVKLKKAKALDAKAIKAIANEATYDKAVLYLEEATSLAPKWDKGWQDLAAVYLQLKSYANAAKAFEKLSALHPDDYAIKRDYAKCLIESNSYDEAQALWQQLLERDGNDAEAVYYMALIAYNQDYLTEASKLANDACILKPNYYRAIALKVKIDTRTRHYFEAAKNLQLLKDNLPESDPDRIEAETQEERINDGVRAMWIVLGVSIVIVIGIGFGAFYIKRMTTKVSIKAPPAQMDSISDDSICRYVLAHVMNITQLPRGLCWTVPMDGRHIELQLSELISDTSAFALRSLNKSSVGDFVESFGKSPFLYKTVCKDALFKETFPGLAEELQDIEINVGVPIVWQENLLGLILLGRSRNSDRNEAKKNFENGIEKMQEISEQGAAALDRLRQRKIKDVDTRTGLWNRDYFETKIVDTSRGCAIVNIPLCAYMATMDGISNILESHDEEFGNEFLYRIGNSLQASIAKEINIILCHLDNGVFGIIAPERDADEGIRLAKTLQTFISQVELPAEDRKDGREKATATVAWTIFPEDSDDPKMLRAVLSRAFRDAKVSGGDAIVRAENVAEATKAASAPVVEKDPNEGLVVTRRAVGAVSVNPIAGVSGGPIPGIMRSPNAPAAPSSAIKLNVPQASAAAAAAAAAGRRIAAPPAPAGSVQLGKGPESGQNQPLSRINSIPAPPGAVSVAKSAAPSVPAAPFKIEPRLDEDGFDLDTEFCGEEAFRSVVNDEVSEAESGECAMVYMRFDNLKELRAKGKDEYMRIRKEVAALVNAFVRADLDIPGLVGEDDFAVFMAEAGISDAMNLADRVRLTSDKLGVEMAVGVVMMQLDSGSSGDELIQEASDLAKGAGVHTNSAS